MTRITSLLALALFSTTGCELADDDYPGEPLISLTGTIQNELTGSETAEVRLVWHFDVGDGDQLSAEVADVTGSFPAALSLNLYGPPEGGAAEALLTIGFISVLAPGTEPPLDESDLLGISESHVVLYLPTGTADLSPEIREQAIAQFGQDLPAGFTLAEVVPATDGVFDTMRIVPANDPISVRMAPSEELDIPNVF